MSERTTSTAEHLLVGGAERRRGAGMSERSERTMDTAEHSLVPEPSASEVQA
ncbi:hypothetical protein [Nocardia sp. Marseille-Q1738]